MFFSEELGKRENIVFTFFKCWLQNFQFSKTIIQVLAKATFLYRFFHILIGSRNNTYIRTFHLITSYRVKLFLLKNTQKKNLHGIRHITDFIQK